MSINVNKWDPNDVKIGGEKVLQVGAAKILGLKSSVLNGSIMIETPEIKTFGINDYEDKDKNTRSGTFKLALMLDDSFSPEVAMFKEKLTQFHEAVIPIVEKYSEKLFGSEYDANFLTKTAYKLVKYPNIAGTKKPDYDKNPTLQAKVPNKFDKVKGKVPDVFDIEIYDSHKRLIFPSEDPSVTPTDLVPSGSVVKALIKCSGICAVNTNWGVGFNAVQIIVLSSGTQKLRGKCLISAPDPEEDADDVEDDVKEETPAPKQTVNNVKYNPTKAKSTPAVTVPVAEFEEEEEEADPFTKEEEDEPVPEPVKVSAPVAEPEFADDDEDDEIPPEPVKKAVPAKKPATASKKPTATKK